MESPRVRRALISVSDKQGLSEFAAGLARSGVEIYSTGGTRRHLESEGIEVRDISEYTLFPEMMDGRLKTLHPKVFGGILCRHDRDDDMNSISEHGIHTFELVVVNLYPFAETISREGVTEAEAVEQIDIGGPSLVRAAAKNHKFVTIATAPSQYAEILSEIEGEHCTSLALRRKLMAAAFEHTANYDRVIAQYFSAGDAEESTVPNRIDQTFELKATLRYGENPHQKAALYHAPGATGANLVQAIQLNGKELSYNNILDLDSALAIVKSLPDAAVAVIKHNNPCGAASAASVAEATRLAMEGDPVSAFGSVLGMNRPVDAAAAEYLATPGLFVEAIVAPAFDDEALEILTSKPKWKKNVRLMKVGDLEEPAIRWQIRPIDGGTLIQETDVLPDLQSDWKVVTKAEPSAELMAELVFGWAICRHVKSNAITISKNRALRGAGAGQMSRVDSVEIAIRKSGAHCRGAVLASDAFFPFPDSIHQASEAGVAAIIQPGGSIKDSEVIDACDQFGIPMVFTGRRHFKH